MVKATGASARVELMFGSEEEAKAIHSSLKLEEKLPESARCKVEVARRKNVLFIEIDARDTAALRAALNSFLRWTMVARDVIRARG
ncbi:MAG: KEOPS complex subunit Pcc1 [Hadesarchaea archaeon]|nr:KEOPS complex subunit Pcc1 [Hadesarchaea archaeon]